MNTMTVNATMKQCERNACAPPDVPLPPLPPTVVLPPTAVVPPADVLPPIVAPLPVVQSESALLLPCVEVDKSGHAVHEVSAVP